ncbi:unnamed protein product, partial [Mesorhabditis spiculigera]
MQPCGARKTFPCIEALDLIKNEPTNKPDKKKVLFEFGTTPGGSFQACLTISSHDLVMMVQAMARSPSRMVHVLRDSPAQVVRSQEDRFPSSNPCVTSGFGLFDCTSCCRANLHSNFWSTISSVYQPGFGQGQCTCCTRGFC